MNKEQYIEELKQRLNGMDDCDIKDAIDYCEEYFDEAGEGNEQEVINDLGTPAKFAAQIRAESTIRRASSKTRKSNQRTTANSSLKNLGIILVGVCALPIALPLLIALAALIFALIVTLLALAFAGVVAFVATIFGGIPLIISGILNFSNPGNAFMSIGGGCLSIGVGLLFIILIYTLIKVLIPLFTQAVARIYDKAKGGRRYERK